MKKRILIILAIVLSIALLCVCTLPLKTEIALSLPGGRIDLEGNPLSDEPVTIQGWRRDYLLRKSTMELHLTFPDLDTRTTSETPYPFEIWDGILHQHHTVYVSNWNSAASCSVFLSEDGSWYLVRIENRLYYGSAAGGPTPAEIIAITGVTKNGF